jgi:hypothetical protein
VYFSPNPYCNFFSCIADWRFRVFFPCRKFHLAWGCQMSRVLYNGTLRMTSFMNEVAITYAVVRK